MKATYVLAALALGFGMVGMAGAMEDSACYTPAADSLAVPLDDCFKPAQVAAYQPRLINVSPVDVDYGEIKVGASVTVPVKVTNLTNQVLQLAGGGFNDPGAFSASAGSCGGGLPANGSCALNYSFRPTSSGQVFTASTTIVFSNGAVGSTGQVLKFRGSGTESLAQVTPVAIDFGDALLGQTLTVPVTLRNTHDAAVSLAGGGVGSGGFSGSIGTCNPSGVAAGTSCAFNYSFTPVATGMANGSTGISLSAPTNLSMYSPLTLKGNGVLHAPGANVYPRSVDFGNVKIGRTASVPVTIKNNTNVALSLSGGGFNDSAGGAFGSSSGCGGVIAVGSSCTLTYRFQPRLAETVSATTSIGLSGTGVPYQNASLSFTGSGIGTLAQVSPTTFDFGQVRTGTSMSLPVKITNTSEAPLTGFIGGAVPYPFAASNGCPASLAVGASCTIDYTFSASVSRLGPHAADTVISFTNNTGVRPNVLIHMDATSVDPDRIFFNGFD